MLNVQLIVSRARVVVLCEHVEKMIQISFCIHTWIYIYIKVIKAHALRVIPSTNFRARALDTFCSRSSAHSPVCHFSRNSRLQLVSSLAGRCTRVSSRLRHTPPQVGARRLCASEPLIHHTARVCSTRCGPLAPPLLPAHCDTEALRQPHTGAGKKEN